MSFLSAGRIVTAVFYVTVFERLRKRAACIRSAIARFSRHPTAQMSLLQTIFSFPDSNGLRKDSNTIQSRPFKRS